MARPLVVIESPYAGETLANVAYARRALLDSISRGEAPLASHLLYTQVLDDDQPGERELGIRLGYESMSRADRVVFYSDLGWSRGMLNAWAEARELGLPRVVRWLDPPRPGG